MSNCITDEIIKCIKDGLGQTSVYIIYIYIYICVFYDLPKFSKVSLILMNMQIR